MLTPDGATGWLDQIGMYKNPDNYLPIYYVLPSSLKTTFGGCWFWSIIGEGTLIWAPI